MISIEEVRRLLDYNRETGEMRWLVPPSNFIEIGSVAGSLRDDGYLVIGFNYKVIMAHRIAWAHHYGEQPPAMLDHINGIRTDNRIVNLRPCDSSGNGQNLRKAYANNKSSGVLGVYFHSPSKKWQARIQVNKKSKSLGLFLTKEEASEAYIKAKRDLHPFGNL